MQISVIIPALNEEAALPGLIAYLRKNDGGVIKEIIVADGGSTDNTIAVAESAGAKVVVSGRARRSVQMNLGAEAASGEILYFLHADTLPPEDFAKQIEQSAGRGYTSGCFMLSFNIKDSFLNMLGKFTAYDVPAFRFGDQSLFITIEAFKKLNGFNEKLIVLEDNEIIKRIKKNYKFEIIKKPVITSSRKYMAHGKYKLQLVFTGIYFLYAFKAPQAFLIKFYKFFIKDERVVE